MCNRMTAPWRPEAGGSEPGRPGPGLRPWSKAAAVTAIESAAEKAATESAAEKRGKAEA